MNNRGPRTDPWRTMFQCTPVREKIISYIRGFYFNFLFSNSHKGLQPVFLDTPWGPKKCNLANTIS